MKRGFKITVAVLASALLCIGGISAFAFRYWIQRSAAMPTKPTEKSVMWTGVFPTTNGWDFKLSNLIDLQKKNVGAMAFCEKTRQLFVGFGGDNTFYQWDIDTGKRVQTFAPVKGFIQWVDAVSPDGKYLIVTRSESQGSKRKNLIMSVGNQTVAAELGDLGAIFECRFSSDGKQVLLYTGIRPNDPLVFTLDGDPVNSFSEKDFPQDRDYRIWKVPVSKDQKVKPGLYVKDYSVMTNLLTAEHISDYYSITKDGRFVVATDYNDEIVIWDYKSTKELIRQRITNHHNLGGYLIYDRMQDRFLILDPSYQGTTHLRVLVATKRS